MNERDAYLPNQFASLFQIIDLANNIIKNGGTSGEKELFLKCANNALKDGPAFFEAEFERIITWAGPGVNPESGNGPHNRSY